MRVELETIKEQVAPVSAAERAATREALQTLARPRLAGSDGAEEVARELRRRFQDLGYRVREIPFSFSIWPGRFGMPFAGAVYLVAVLTAALLLVSGRGLAAVLTLIALAAGVVGMAAYFRTAILRLPWGRVRTSNWIVHRPGARPRHLITAHRDSKSQGLSLELRVASIGLAGLAWAALLALAVLTALRPGWTPVAPTLLLAVPALAAGAGLLACYAANRSAGALDNASGLAALLGIARRQVPYDDVAFLVTDGEELGLAGAWAVTPLLPPLRGIINLDGLDDHGDFHLVERYGWPRRGFAPHLVAALLASAAALGIGAHRRALPLGVLVDHIAFAEAGIASLTLMRGSHRSLRRAHRPEDDLDHIDGEGASAAVALVAGALSVLRRETAEPHP